MEKEFVPYTESLELKSIGFDEPCFATYEFEKLFIGEFLNSMSFKLCEKTEVFPAPTYSQAFRWFREKYNLKSWIEEHTVDTFIYEIRPHKLTDYRVGEVYASEKYEVVELECLRKLIEIIKNK